MVKQGLKENRVQFVLLVLINAFVGGMAGLERSIFPEFAGQVFGVKSATAILSFIAAFGLSKAITNYWAGKAFGKFSRKNVLLAGWLLAIPVPWLLMYAPHWSWVIVANILLGISQGLTWSATVIMKIDLAGVRNRGLAMGFNEFAGYMAVGLMAYFSGYLAHHYGITPYPFLPGIVLSLAGFLLSLIWVKDTAVFVALEERNLNLQASARLIMSKADIRRNLRAITQAGLVNNLNDGMIWGLLPMWLLKHQTDPIHIAVIVAFYPVVWGMGQLLTGKMADHYSQKGMLFWGMLIQGLAILAMALLPGQIMFYAMALSLGLGTALVYPTFFTAISRIVKPADRARHIGNFRFWRDMGYVFGALVSGLMADWLGLAAAMVLIGVLTIFSSAWIGVKMLEKAG